MKIEEKQMPRGFFITVTEGDISVDVYQQVSLVTGKVEDVKIAWAGSSGSIIEDAEDFRECLVKALQLAGQRI